MKVEHLRIGNMVYVLDEDFAKTSLKVDLNDLCNIDCNPELYEPIPLDDEWLIKLGFKRSSEKLIYLSMPQIKSEIHFEKHAYGNVIILHSNVGMFIPNDIEYIHELQNLFFAITGEELLIK